MLLVFTLSVALATAVGFLMGYGLRALVERIWGRKRKVVRVRKRLSGERDAIKSARALGLRRKADREDLVFQALRKLKFTIGEIDAAWSQVPAQGTTNERLGIALEALRQSGRVQ